MKWLLSAVFLCVVVAGCNRPQIGIRPVIHGPINNAELRTRAFDRIHKSMETRGYDLTEDVEEHYLSVGVEWLKWCESRGYDPDQAYKEMWQRWELENEST